jgi:hypothetical protein
MHYYIATCVILAFTCLTARMMPAMLLANAFLCARAFHSTRIGIALFSKYLNFMDVGHMPNVQEQMLDNLRPAVSGRPHSAQSHHYKSNASVLRLVFIALSAVIACTTSPPADLCHSKVVVPALRSCIAEEPKPDCR